MSLVTAGVLLPTMPSVDCSSSWRSPSVIAALCDWHRGGP
jgi:hypothetical protein